MIEITLKGRKQFYLTRDEEIPEWVEDNVMRWRVVKYDPNVVRILTEYIQRVGNLRFIIVRTISDWGWAGLCFVYWFKPYDLDDLDMKLTQNIPVGNAFEKTIITGYQKTVCYMGCKSWWHTLIYPRGSLLSEPTALNGEKIGTEVMIKGCPECGASFRQPIIHIISKASPDDDH